MFDTKDRDELIDILDSFQIAMFAVDLTEEEDAILLGRNRAFCRLHDVAPEQDIGKRMSQILPDDDAAFVNAMHQTCAAAREPIQVATTLTYSVGKVRHLTSLIPVIDPQCNVSRVIGNVVGERLQGSNHTLSLTLDELTRISAESLTPLYKTLRATERRAAKQSDLSPEDQAFLATFNTLCAKALASSRQLHGANSDGDLLPRTQEYLLTEGEVARAVREFSGDD